MNGNSLIADTNILLYLLNGDKTLAKILNNKKIYISFISELELQCFKNLSLKEKTLIDSLINDCIIIDINDVIKQNTIEIRKRYALKLPDAIIAASAEYLNLPLLTSDSDFNKIIEINTIYYSH
ncbi:MAG: PIN domain-containing protein [Ignavibacteriae bacterium]|nr:PIN domain-containing protein [Ignavibacteriota bacterium]